VQVPHCSWQSKAVDEAPYKLSEASEHHLLEFGFLLDTRNLGFLLREKLAVVLIIPSSWGSQLDSDLHQHTVSHHTAAMLSPSPGHRLSPLGMHLSIILYNTSSSPPLYSLGKHDV
jgi:hypothetical protein